MQTWDETEITRFVEGGKDSPYYELFYTALFTGMRRSELLALSWRDVDSPLGQVCVNRSPHHLKDGRYVFTEPKSDKSRRTIALPPSLAVPQGFQEALERGIAPPIAPRSPSARPSIGATLGYPTSYVVRKLVQQPGLHLAPLDLGRPTPPLQILPHSLPIQP